MRNPIFPMIDAKRGAICPSLENSVPVKIPSKKNMIFANTFREKNKCVIFSIESA